MDSTVFLSFNSNKVIIIYIFIIGGIMISIKGNKICLRVFTKEEYHKIMFKYLQISRGIYDR